MFNTHGNFQIQLCDVSTSKRFLKQGYANQMFQILLRMSIFHFEEKAFFTLGEKIQYKQIGK